MLRQFLIALVLTIAYIGLQYDFTKKIKTQKNIFIMGSIIFTVVFVGCWLIMPKKKSVNFSNDVHVKTYDKTKSLTDADGYHDGDSSDGSDSDGSVDNYQSQQGSYDPSSNPSLSSTPSLYGTGRLPIGRFQYLQIQTP